jgi:hypothetical protein
MGVLRTIFWILLGYYLLKILGRLLRPWLHSYARKKTEDLFRQAASDPRRSQDTGTKVGEVTIDKPPPARMQSRTKVGEYIDYEEVE